MNFGLNIHIGWRDFSRSFLSSSMPGTGTCKIKKIRAISTKTQKMKFI